MEFDGVVDAFAPAKVGIDIHFGVGRFAGSGSEGGFDYKGLALEFGSRIVVLDSEDEDLADAKGTQRFGGNCVGTVVFFSELLSLPLASSAFDFL